MHQNVLCPIYPYLLQPAYFRRWLPFLDQGYHLFIYFPKLQKSRHYLEICSLSLFFFFPPSKWRLKLLSHTNISGYDLHCTTFFQEKVFSNIQRRGPRTHVTPWGMMEGHLLFVPYSVDYTEGLLGSQGVF